VSARKLKGGKKCAKTERKEKCPNISLKNWRDAIWETHNYPLQNGLKDEFYRTSAKTPRKKINVLNERSKEKVSLPPVSNYFPPAVSGSLAGHVPLCTKSPFMKSFLVQVKSQGGGSNWTPTVRDLRGQN